MIYFDNNATTAPLPEVIDAVARVMRDCFGNPGSRHRAGQKARQVLESCREQIAACLGADPKELLFTSGGTEANNLAIRGLTRGSPGTLVISPGEHPSAMQVCRALQLEGWNVCEFPVDNAGRLVPFHHEELGGRGWTSEAVEASGSEGFAETSANQGLPGETKLVAIILAHNETGVIQDVGPISAICQLRRIPLHLDAVQAVGKIPVDFQALGATTLSFGAHKFHGPRGIGGLLVREGTRLAPLLHGGHQESERRPGTESVALVAGMAKALELWQAEEQTRTAHVEQLRDLLQATLCDRCAPAVVHGANARRLPNTLNLSFPGVDGEALLVALDLAGIACSLGTTCASGSSEPAPILLAMGLNSDLYRSAIRFSLSPLNTAAEIVTATERIARVVDSLRKQK